MSPQGKLLFIACIRMMLLWTILWVHREEWQSHYLICLTLMCGAQYKGKYSLFPATHKNNSLWINFSISHILFKFCMLTTCTFDKFFAHQVNFSELLSRLESIVLVTFYAGNELLYFCGTVHDNDSVDWSDMTDY